MTSPAKKKPGPAKGTRPSGRKKGTPNKRSFDAMAKLEKLGHDPISGMVRVYKKALTAWVKAVDEGDPLAFKYLEIAQKCEKDLMPYRYPALSAIAIGAGDEEARQTLTAIFAGLAKKRLNKHGEDDSDNEWGDDDFIDVDAE